MTMVLICSLIYSIDCLKLTCSNNLNAGLNDGMIGPTLSDLQLVADSNVEQTSIVFTWRALLAVAGSLACSRLTERWSHPVLIGVTLLLQAIACAATPWIPDVLLMGAVSGIAAFFTGGLVTGVYFYTYHLWQAHSKKVIRGIRLCYTLGLAGAPLVVSNFLYRPPRTPDGKRIDKQERHIYSSSNSTNQTMSIIPEENTHVQYAYAVVALFSILVALMFFSLARTCDTSEEHKLQKRQFNTSIVFSYRHSTKLHSQHDERR